MQQSIRHSILLVPRGTRRVAQHRRPRRATLVDRAVSLISLDHRLLYCHEGYTEQWESKWCTVM